MTDLMQKYKCPGCGAECAENHPYAIDPVIERTCVGCVNEARDNATLEDYKSRLKAEIRKGSPDPRESYGSQMYFNACGDILKLIDTT